MNKLLVSLALYLMFICGNTTALSTGVRDSGFEGVNPISLYAQPFLNTKLQHSQLSRAIIKAVKGLKFIQEMAKTDSPTLTDEVREAERVVRGETRLVASTLGDQAIGSQRFLEEIISDITANDIIELLKLTGLSEQENLCLLGEKIENIEGLSSLDQSRLLLIKFIREQIMDKFYDRLSRQLWRSTFSVLVPFVIYGLF